jgi:hypothetical protein
MSVGFGLGCGLGVGFGLGFTTIIIPSYGLRGLIFFFLDNPASDMAIAIACFLFFTLGPFLLPDFKVPSLNSVITLWTLACPFFFATLAFQGVTFSHGL